MIIVEKSRCRWNFHMVYYGNIYLTVLEGGVDEV